MTIKRVLIANRGEVAIRILRAAKELEIATVGVYSEDDSESLHVRLTDEAHLLKGSGPRPYLDIEQLIAVAKGRRCGAVHPGYGFLAENAAFARRCEAEGIVFVGPSAEALSLFGDKVRARALAIENHVPVLSGSAGPVTAEEAKKFLATMGENRGVVIKAVAGGGGRGMRVVWHEDEVD